ncbi:UDP-N-acetylglucosamine--N-acetylmuramyl-(pentapeptide) pyrophosphoryl-undecaprenol N-acetylglucosamine transferase-like [Oratosquilla oratoria]|uniref:UDP-N-acetylglucosamine--N-acetylmuramyl- (pentapeptide) pyrophosphoryl-undecaprenol N-acetylglucosamine transferase-like n=1 Tax=Oratosquilla oratoria TaxID=337810 RepID=UPI003F776881
MGGFVAGPGGLMAKLLGKKLVIHEQNAIAGTTNRLLARLADVVLAAMPSAFDDDRVESTQAAYDAVGVEARVVAFIDDMAEAYAWADLVVSRAGAMSVAELSASGSASVLVPYPFAVDDHQTANCTAMVREGAALLVPQPRFDAELLSKLFTDLRNDRERLMTMACAARRLAKPDAVREVAKIVMENAQ